MDNYSSSINLKNILKGVLISLISTLILLLIYSIILTYTSIGENTMGPVVIIITAISILIGSSIGSFKINKNGINGIKLNNVPKGYLALLRNYTGVYDLTAEAVIHRKKEFAIQSILANPVVNVCKNIEEMIDRMIDMQKPYLDYLK